MGERRVKLWIVSLAVAALSIAPAHASANHQPGDYLAKPFEATIDVTGQYNASVADTSGGSWTIQSTPSWKVVFPQLLVPMSEDVTLNASADYTRSAATAGTVTWAGTTQLDGMNGPDPFLCSAPVAGPQIIGRSFQYRDIVIGHGENIDFELTTLNEFGLGPGGSPAAACSPPPASGFTPWSTELNNFTQVFLTIPRQELFEENLIFRNVSDDSAGIAPSCTVAGSCVDSMNWNGTLKLKKRCRNYAGTATNFGSGIGETTAPFCESECSEGSCSQADFEMHPLASAAKEEGGSVDFSVSCYGATDCNGDLSLVKKASGAGRAAPFGSGDFTVEPTAHATAEIDLSRAGKKTLKKKGKIKGTLQSTISGDVADESDSLKVTVKR
ncbi:MAG TPA: hypothetical protein VD766_13010 [Solirubrobacterales bacterium]|nr:hypothetical protein [Solirubrobacterales bacterium]